MRVFVAALIFFGACAIGWFSLERAKAFSSDLTNQAHVVNKQLTAAKSELSRQTDENMMMENRLTELKKMGFFHVDRVKILDFFAGLKMPVNYTLSDEVWSGMNNGKKFTAKISINLAHEGRVLMLLNLIKSRQLGLLSIDSVELSRNMDNLTLSAKVNWFGVTEKLQ